MRLAIGVLVLGVTACRSGLEVPSSARYVVTAEPILVVNSIRLCIAIDPADAQGVWWWEPGRSGCSSRSTGPDVFRGSRASVVKDEQSGSIEASFRLQLITGPGYAGPDFADVRLGLERDSMVAVGSGARVLVQRRSKLDLPEEPPYGRR